MHVGFAQRICMFRGSRSVGIQAKLSREKGVAHHGQALIGAGASRPSRRERRTRATAVSLRPSPVLQGPVGGGGGAEPEADLDRPVAVEMPVAFLPSRLTAHQF